MRVSSSTLFNTNVASLSQQQALLLKTQQQVATGRRIQTPADDPVAAARALEISQSDATNTQYALNRTAARHTLSLAEVGLQSVTTLLQDVKTAVVGAGNGSLSNSDRQTYATELSGRLQELIGLANSTDGVGNYLFSGFQSKTQPFANTAAGMSYFGDDGQRLVQVSASRQLASSESGADIFMRIKNGNGTFVTQAATTPVANTGSGVISSGSVVDPAVITGHNYAIQFTTATNYNVFDTTLDPTMAGAPLLANQAYVSGQAISFDGMRFDIQGAPAGGDSFTVTPSTNESVFKTISDLITSLNTPIATGSAADHARLANSINLGLGNLDNALNKVLTTRSSLGLRLNEVDALQMSGDDLGLQLKQSLSTLQDIDYNKALSDLTQQDIYLKAAQQSFVKVAGLSLFNYL